MFMIDLDAESHYSILGVAPEASPVEIRRAKSRIVGDLERKRQQARTPDEQRKLQERMIRINAVGDLLTNPELRFLYDTKNAHLTFFIVRKAAALAMEDSEIRLRWMHRIIYAFLIEEGEHLEPFSDLERLDFTEDYTRNEFLERLLNRGRLR